MDNENDVTLGITWFGILSGWALILSLVKNVWIDLVLICVWTLICTCVYNNLLKDKPLDGGRHE